MCGAGGSLGQPPKIPMGSQWDSRSCCCSRGPAVGVGWWPLPWVPQPQGSSSRCLGKDKRGHMLGTGRGHRACRLQRALNPWSALPGVVILQAWGHSFTGRGHGAAPGGRYIPRCMASCCHLPTWMVGDRMPSGEQTLAGTRSGDRGGTAEHQRRSFISPKQLPAPRSLYF